MRLPLLSRGKSIVLVEMDSTKNRDDVIEHKDDLRKFRSPLVQVGIRRARYRELWKYVRGMTVAKEVLGESKPQEVGDGVSITDLIDDSESDNEQSDAVTEEDSESVDEPVQVIPAEEDQSESDIKPAESPDTWQENDEDESEVLEAVQKKDKDKKKTSGGDKTPRSLNSRRNSKILNFLNE